MAFVGQSIADGYVRSFQNPLLTASAATIVNYIRFLNESSTAQTVSVYIRRSGSDARLQSRSAGMAQYATLEPLSDNQEIVLSAGDAIEASTTSEQAVNYVICGAVFA